MRVVQIEPGPMPTLTASAPATARSRATCAVPILPPTTDTSPCRFLIRTAINHTDGVRGRIHDNHIDARFNQRRHSVIGVRRGADSCGRSQPALFIFAGIGKIFDLRMSFRVMSPLSSKASLTTRILRSDVGGAALYLSKIKVFLNGNQRSFGIMIVSIAASRLDSGARLDW